MDEVFVSPAGMLIGALPLTLAWWLFPLASSVHDGDSET